MTFKHKISRRLALLRGALLLAAGAMACSDQASLTGPGGEGTPNPGAFGTVLSGTTPLGARVQANAKAYIRTGPSVSSSLAGTQPKGARGTIIGGPVVDSAGDKLTRYNVNFDSGVDGWAAAPYLDQTGLSPVATIVLTPSPASVDVGQTIGITAVLRDAAGNLLAGRTISWAIDDTATASVSSSGIVTGRKLGTTIVRATAEGRVAHDTVHVKDLALRVGVRARVAETAYLRSTPSSSGVLVGTQPVGALGTVMEGPIVDTAGDGLTRWRIDFDSGVDGWGAEPYVVRDGSGGSTGGASTVNVTPAAVSIAVGATTQLTAIATDASGANVQSPGFTWLSRDTSKVRVTSVGLATAVAVGTVWVVATSGGESDSAAVTVTAVPVATVSVSPATVSLLPLQTAQFTATLRDAQGNVLTGRSVTWTSSAPTLLGISSTGLVTALLTGSATVTATSEGKSATATITIGTSTPTVRVGKYVAPNGTSGNDGSVNRPWDLATALAGAGGRIVAGDTVWVRAGTYRGPFTSTLTGTSSRPIVVRAYPGERATIEHGGTGLTTLHVRGAWSVFWGLEVMNPGTTRVTSSTASEERANGVVNNASNTKYINMIIHDAGVGLYNYTNLTNVEVNGSIFYNNGWQGPDRGHGHAIYVKSDNGPILLKDNVMFNQFGYGMHAYTNAGSGKLNNIRIEGNTSFNNGTLSTNSNSENILLGGADYSTGSAVVNNLTYFSPGKGGRNVRVGYGTLQNGSVTVTGNQFVGGTPVLDFGYWSSATVGSNLMVGAGQMVRQNNASTGGLSWLANIQRRDPASTSWYSGGSWRTFSAWKTATGLGLTDQALSGLPTGAQVFVRPSTYEAGRATITVYDWSKSGSVLVNLAGVLSIGDRFEVRSVQSLFGQPLVSGTFNGSVVLPVGAVGPTAPVGMSASVAPRLGADFDVFVVTKLP
jgi:hypothetical protein